ncbi:sugar transferase [Novosphingobium lentum]|uniref:sugar transferase n=1 Tax=Novosphingobium lentum TaxID=145287 RepID=UPI000AF8929A|nr:sugar transferase [Novosphingobium lentum]
MEHAESTIEQAAKGAVPRRVTLPLAPSLERRRLQSYLLLLLADGAAIVLAFGIVGYLYFGEWSGGRNMLQAQILLPLYWTAALVLNVYSLPSLINLGYGKRRAMLAIFAALTITAFVAFFAKASAQFSRFTTTAGLLFAVAMLLYLRSMLQPVIVRRCGPTAQNVLLLDDGGVPVRIPHAYHIDTREHHLVPDLDNPGMLDRIAMYLTNMDRVIVSCPQDRRGDWAYVFKGANVQGEIIDREVLSLGVLGARRGRGFGSLVVSGGPLGLRSRVAKRGLDLAMAGSAMIVLLPLFLVVALAIKLEDGGPVFFVQQRTGRGNRFFSIYKFRSMRVERHDASGHVSASRDDDRITRIGRLIRRTSIDELPQLLNVIRGEMSLVGPRPHALGSLAGDKKFWEVDRRYWLRHSLKPGLTGLAQVRGLRGATDSESDLTDRLQADLEYLDGWTVMRDLRIIASTVRVIVHDRAF